MSHERLLFSSLIKAMSFFPREILPCDSCLSGCLISAETVFLSDEDLQDSESPQKANRPEVPYLATLIISFLEKIPSSLGNLGLVFLPIIERLCYRRGVDSPFPRDMMESPNLLPTKEINLLSEISGPFLFPTFSG